MRKYLRQIARNRMKALGVGNVNRQMSRVQDGIKNWLRALTGETGEAARQAQMKVGRAVQTARRNAGITRGYIKKGVGA